MNGRVGDNKKFLDENKMKLSLQNILSESLTLRRVHSGLWVTPDNVWEIVRDPFGPGSGWLARA